MGSDVGFLAGLLDAGDSACVSWEDFTGRHAAALRAWQELRFLAREGSANPTPSCPHCGDGSPYRLGTRHLCDRCHSTVDSRWTLLWPFHRDRFLRWLGEQLRLRGDLQRIDGELWQLGTWEGDSEAAECFYRGRGPLSEAAWGRLAAYRSAVVLYALSPPQFSDRYGGPTLSLLELLAGDGTTLAVDLGQFLRPRGNVRFDAQSGAFWVGERWVGEVPVGSKEFFLVQCLAEQLDRFVPYADLKREVRRRSGSADTRDEAGFCQQLKRRLKEKYVPVIDRLIVTTNKADGYRLRGFAEL